MPKELVCVEVGKLAWQPYEERKLAVGQVRIRAEFGAAKHGTEMSIFKGYGLSRGWMDGQTNVFNKNLPMASFPFVVGNMVVGTLMEVGAEVGGLAVGQRVVTFGGFRQTHVASAVNCRTLDREASWKAAVCVDPAQFAFSAVRDGHVRIGDAVAVFGMGAIGLIAIQLCRAAGATTIIALDPLQSRREVAISFGATLALDPSACDAGLEIKKATNYRGVDVAIDFSGAQSAMQHALRGVAYGGNVVAGAFPPPYGAGLDFGAEGHVNIANIIFSRGCSQPDRDHPRWNEQRVSETCFQLLMSGTLTGEKIVTPVVPFEEIIHEYPKIATDPSLSVKLGVSY